MSWLTAVCNKAGVDLDDIPLSIYHLKRFEKIKNLGDQIRQDIMERKKLCIYVDGKQVKQIEEDLNITVNVERISISVSYS